MKIFSITPENKFKEYAEIGFQHEHQEVVLESWLENNPDKIIENGSLLFIGRQVTTNLGSFIDLLAVDRQGDLAVLELKRDRTPRETLSQALEYASFVEKLGYDQLEDILRNYADDAALNLAQYHKENFGLVSDEAVVFNNDQRIVIVGQQITPEIRQTSSYLRNKGVRVTCLEFTFFKADGGLRLLSTNIVVGNEADAIAKISSGSMPIISESKFLASLDENGRSVFMKIFEWSKINSFPIHWGTKGFSLNVDLSGMHVAFCYGYPPDSVFRQSIYTALVGRGGLLSKTNISEQELQKITAEGNRPVCFHPAGREFKCLLDRKFNEQDVNELITWLAALAKTIQEHGLRGQGESQG